MSGTRLMSSASTRGLCCATSAPICSRHILRVDEEEAPLRPHDQQALEGLVVRVLGRQRSQHVGAALAADDGHARVGGLAGQADHRHDDRHDDSLQRAEQQHAERGDRAPSGTPSCAPCGWRGTPPAGSARPSRR